MSQGSTPRRLAVRNSPVHGRGVFALTDFSSGERIVQYRGEVIPWALAQERYEGSEAAAGHTFFFDRGDGTVIDGGSKGNVARWINHGCEPNCETLDDNGKIFIIALHSVHAGDELFIDYGLIIDGRVSAATRAHYACACGARSCRGTMLVK